MLSLRNTKTYSCRFGLIAWSATTLALFVASACCGAQNQHSPRKPSVNAANAARRRAAAAIRQHAAREIQIQHERRVTSGMVVVAPRAAIVNPPDLEPRRLARKMLQMMLRPSASYTGIQETVINSPGGTTSEQEVRGDTRGFVRTQFRSPEQMAGDVMIVSPNSFYSYHRAKNLLEVAPWPTEWNDESKRLFVSLGTGSVTARIVGTETIAGRLATIVVLSVPGPGVPNGRVLRKFWIDQQTGIQLRIEKSNSRGQITSTTTMTSITVNPAAPVLPEDFRPQFPGATITPLFPEPQFRSMAEAQNRMPFQPMEPVAAALPPNYQLDGVWVFGDSKQIYQHTVLMRYSDGVTSFCLYEKLVLPANNIVIQHPKTRAFARNQQNWRFALSQGSQLNVQYIGHLTANQAEALYDSMH